MKTTELHNPNNITGVITKQNKHFDSENGWMFQEYPKQVEVWYGENERLFLYKRLNKSSITLANYNNSQSLELLRPYIK